MGKLPPERFQQLLNSHEELLNPLLVVNSLLGGAEEEESESEDDSQESVLIRAARLGNANTLATFLEQGVDINGIYGSESLLCIAIHNANEEVVKFLLQKEANINLNTNYSSNKKEYTALHVAAQYADIDIMQWLIEKGADLNAKDDEGDTPLHWIYIDLDGDVSSDKRTEAVKLLIEKGADFHIKNIKGKTASDCAAEALAKWEEVCSDTSDVSFMDMKSSVAFLQSQYNESDDANSLKRERAESENECIENGPEIKSPKIDECELSFLDDIMDVLGEEFPV